MEILQKWKMIEISFFFFSDAFCENVLWLYGGTGSHFFPLFPEDTMKLLGLKCSSGQESPSQNMSISSRFVF